MAGISLYFEALKHAEPERDLRVPWNGGIALPISCLLALIAEEMAVHGYALASPATELPHASTARLPRSRVGTAEGTRTPTCR